MRNESALVQKVLLGSSLALGLGSQAKSQDCDLSNTGKVYWVNYEGYAGGYTPDTIRRANLDGTEQEIVLTAHDYPQYPFIKGLAVDQEEDWIYWGELEVGISKVRKDGTENQVIIPMYGLGNEAKDMVVNSEEKRIYWTEEADAGNYIKRANLDGTDETILASTLPGKNEFYKIDLDLTTKKIYYTQINEGEESSFFGMHRINLDGTGLESVLTDWKWIGGIANNPVKEVVYFNGYPLGCTDEYCETDAHIYQVPSDWSGEILVTDLQPGDYPSDLALDSAFSTLYGMDYNSIFKFRDDGLSDPESIVSGSEITPHNNIAIDLSPRSIYDCNSNLTLDTCDISSGTSQDINNNGIPDECETFPCEGDANLDGTVDPLDSGFILARFGCSVESDPLCAQADVNSDGLVDPLDAGFSAARFGDCQ